MKFSINLTLLFAFVSISMNAVCQTEDDSLTFKNMEEKVDSIDSDDFILNFVKFDRYERKVKKKNTDSTEIRDWENNYIEKYDTAWSSYNDVKDLVEYFYALEAENFSETELTSKTNSIIQRFEKLRSLSLLLNYVGEYNDGGTAHNLQVRKKLLHAISSQMQIMAENTQAWYNYSTVSKKSIKGVQIETSNDLFKTCLLQKNDDMDYTGALKISIITDLFKLDAGRPNQSYQVLSYGGEVYTHYFKNRDIFTKEDTFNIYDRPHASFQYLSFENHGISKTYKDRWTTKLQIGIIGGRFGYNFQFFLHRDISLSPYPTGWDAQIAYPGRLAGQFHLKYERQFFKNPWKIWEPNPNRKFQIYPSGSIELAAGHFMTYSEAGIRLASHSFKHLNPNHVLPKSMYKKDGEPDGSGFKYSKKVRLYGALNASLRAVFHNTTLEGFGVFCTNENNTNAFAEKSKYTLDYGDVRRWVIFASYEWGIQTARMNFFYRYNFKSPEYRSQGKIITSSGREMNPNTRWHMYGTIGATFLL